MPWSWDHFEQGVRIILMLVACAKLGQSISKGLL